MTLIVCEKRDCLHVKEHSAISDPGYFRYICGCHAIGIKSDVTCDSYMTMPDELKEHMADQDKRLDGETI